MTSLSQPPAKAAGPVPLSRAPPLSRVAGEAQDAEPDRAARRGIQQTIRGLEERMNQSWNNVTESEEEALARGLTQVALARIWGGSVPVFETDQRGKRRMRIKPVPVQNVMLSPAKDGMDVLIEDVTP